MNPLTTQQVRALLAGLGGGDLIYLVGIGGCGMSGLANLFLDLGFQVAGSDRQANSEIQELRQRGARIQIGHAEANLADLRPALVVFTPAVARDNPELQFAAAQGWPLARRAVTLAALTTFASPLCVAGMHGKTTTSALLSFALRQIGIEPAYAIGASVPQVKPHAGWGRSTALAGSTDKLFVLETDESDGTLCEFQPRHAILLNVDAEHLDHYAGLAEVLADFCKFAGQTTGHLVWCTDDANLVKSFAGLAGTTSYGFSLSADYRCEIQTALPDAPTRFEVWHQQAKLGSFAIRLLGGKNVSNATAVIALLHQLGHAPEDIARAIDGFRGAARRQQELFRDSRFRVFDDYGHHPQEIRAVLESLRRLQPGRLLVAFQPHRYTRTKHLLPEFAACFAEADQLWLAEIYAASEPAIPGISSDVLADAIRARGQQVELVPNLLHLSGLVRAAMRPGDVVLFLGAGDITQVAHALAAQLREEAPGRNDACFAELRRRLSADALLLKDEPLARRTTMRVGGNADLFAEPASEADLSLVLQFCNERQIPFVVLGRGSNLLVRDGGIRGCVISLANPHFSQWQIEGDRITAGAGVRLKTLAVEARKHGLTGLEFIEGIPGSLGGSMRMNAGAMGSWLFDILETIRFMDYHGNVCERAASEVHVEYRGCPLFRNHIALGAVLRGAPADAEAVRARMDGYSHKRWESQPRQPSAGCIFKNPKTIGAGRLIDELGLKGTRVGGAAVSDVHGNFIVNEGNATARDVLTLIEVIRERVRAARGIDLETEVEILGEG
jgi:UDP-N-acetylmuramate--alanine ligase